MEKLITTPYSRGIEKRKKFSFSKQPEHKNVRLVKPVSSISSLVSPEEQTVPVLPMKGSTAMVLSYHHGSKINIIYSEIFNEKKAVWSDM